MDSIFLLMKKSCLLLLIFPSAVSAFCFEEAGEHYNVSPDLLRAIARGLCCVIQTRNQTS